MFASANKFPANLAGANMAKPYYKVATLEPSNSVGYLVKSCGVLLTQIAERRFEALSANFTHWVTLMGLSRQQSPVSATQLSKELCHDMGALTRVVDELERRGLVRRERSRRDRRAVEIAITAAGRRQASGAKRVMVELLNELVEPYSEAEIATLIGLLQRMLQHLQQAAATAPPAATRAATRTARGPRQRSHSRAAA
jgi:DNA-binding MarR family transcriptional regulator